MIQRGAILVLLSSITSDAFQISQIRTVKSSYVASTAIRSTAETTEKPSPIPDFSASKKPVDESDIFADGSSTEASSWQENLELLLAPDTSVAERQIVLSDLLNSGDKIQDSVRAALRERKVTRHVMCSVLILLFISVHESNRNLLSNARSMAFSHPQANGFNKEHELLPDSSPVIFFPA